MSDNPLALAEPGWPTTAVDWLYGDIVRLNETFGPLDVPPAVDVQVRESPSSGTLCLHIRGGSGLRRAHATVSPRDRVGSDGAAFWVNERERWHPSESRLDPIDPIDYGDGSPQAVVNAINEWVCR